MEIVYAIIFGLLGTVIGSFLNVVIDRVPAEKSIVNPPSSCDACQRRLTWIDLVPVFSYIFLRGRCRYCGAKIPLRVLLVELGTGVLTGFLYLHFGFVWHLPVAIVYCGALIAIALIDLQHQLIFNSIVFPVAFFALIINFFVPDLFSLHNFLFGLLGAAVGSIFLLLVMLLYMALRKREGMGLGDVYMAVMMGFMVGFPNIFVALMIAILLGGVIAIFLISFKSKTGTDIIPFGDFLALGTIIALIWGTPILHWYLRLVKLE